MDFKFIESDIGNKKIKTFKRIRLIYLLSIILVSVICLMLCLNIKSKYFVFFVYIVALSIILIIAKKHLHRFCLETLSQEICLDGFINLNIYNIKKVEKKLKVKKFYKIYKYSLLNLIDGYFRKGDFEKVNDIISTLEMRELDATTKSFLISYKASIAFNNNNDKEFYLQYQKFNELSNTISKKIKNQISVSLNLQKYIIENNYTQAVKICEQLQNNKLLLNKVMGAYYKGLLLEKNNNEEYKNYYKFVVENGNDLYISKKVSEKIGMPQQIKYKSKKHIGFKIFTTVFFTLLLFVTIFITLFYIEDSKTKKWDTGIVYINNKEIKLPCTISEFEKSMNVKINIDEISSNGYYKLFFNQDILDINDFKLSSGQYISLIIKGNNITGISIDISNSWNDELDVELGNMVVFPERITANSQIKEIQEVYKTGIINPAMRTWNEKILDYDTKEVKIYSYGFNYSGDKYDISINSNNGKVISILYYYK